MLWPFLLSSRHLSILLYAPALQNSVPCTFHVPLAYNVILLIHLPLFCQPYRSQWKGCLLTWLAEPRSVEKPLLYPLKSSYTFFIKKCSVIRTYLKLENCLLNEESINIHVNWTFFKPCGFIFFMTEMTHALQRIISSISRKCPGSQKFSEWMNSYELDSTTDFISLILPFQWVIRYAQIQSKVIMSYTKNYTFGSGGQSEWEETQGTSRQVLNEVLHLPSLSSLSISGVIGWSPGKIWLERCKAVS